MKYQKTLAVIAAILALLMLAFGCAPAAPEASDSPEPAETNAPAESPEATDAPAETAITVTDMMGREISLEAPAEKVVAITASDCEILYAIGAGDAIVGRGEYCDYPEEVLAVPAVQSGYETNIEQIIALEPQLVFMNAMDQSEQQVSALEEAGIPVVMCNAADIAGVYESIELIGTVMGKSEEACSVIDGMKKTFEDIAAKVPESGEKKTVYFEVSPLEYGLWTAGANTFMNELAEMLGMENAFADVEGWAEISEEQVLERDPDYIVTVAMYFGDGLTPVEEIMARKGWENLTAIKNNAVFNADNNEITRPAPRLTLAAEALYDFVYAE